MKYKIKRLISTLLIIIVISFITNTIDEKINNYYALKIPYYNIDSIPSYRDENYVFINNNIPNFTDDEYLQNSFEYYSELDFLGRAQVAYANIGYDLMPNKEREKINIIKPSGFKTIKYDFIDGKYLYNRCHLIGYQLTGENDNEKNLITCTRQMNTKGMLEFENKVAKYIKKTKNHVLYRVTPIYDSLNLVAKGVQIEASSLEDHCKDICFNVFVYNVQEGVKINYKDGSASLNY